MQKWSQSALISGLLVLNPTLWFNTIWNDIRYSKIRIYTRFTYVGDLGNFHHNLQAKIMAVCI